MEPPYIEKIKNVKGIDVWYVDGEYIRKNIEKDFPNFSAHYYFGFIPENEFWIDREFSKREWRFFLKYFLARQKAIKQGKTPEQAKELGSIAEQEARNKSKLISSIKNLSQQDKISKIHRRLWKKYSKNRIKVWIVRGFLVRSLLFLDFTAGGHEKVYDFVPETEIWIDDSLNPNERESLLLHELYERRLMAEDTTSSSKQESYYKTHEQALILEQEFRDNPKALKKRIRQELEKNQSI